MTRNSLNAYSEQNKASLVLGGKPYFDQLIYLISLAKETLHLQTYIFEEDETGIVISDALLQIAQRGVKVYLMVDGYASQSLSRNFIERLKSGGIAFRFFEPLFKSRRFYLGRRLHHKVCVVDLRYGLVGGINIANHYNDMPNAPAWLDFALFVEGEVAKELFVLCQKTWNGYLPLKRIPSLKNVPAFSFPKNEQLKMRMRRNDWVRRKNQVSLSYLEMFRNANTEIIILSSYFLPGKIFRRAISKARDRGVAITLVIAGVSDVKMAKLAERYMYKWLLLRGIKILEYQRSVLHGKLAICDDHWMTLGSFNVNDISAYASVELNLDVENQVFVSEVKHFLKTEVFAQCRPITDEYVTQHNSPINKFLQWCAFTGVRLIFFFFTFYFKREKR